MAFKHLGHYIYDYKVTANSIEVLLFDKILILRIPLTQDVQIAKISFASSLKPDFITLRLGNTLFGEIVEIKTNRGFFKRILITPTDANRFIAEANKAKNN